MEIHMTFEPAYSVSKGEGSNHPLPPHDLGVVEYGNYYRNYMVLVRGFYFHNTFFC